MSYYNGEFRQVIEISISSDNHDTCKFVANHIRKVCEAWFFNVSVHETKSARKGDVLSRYFQISQVAYASDIIAFSESMRCLCFHYNLTVTSTVFSIRTQCSEDAHVNLRT